MDTLPDEIIEEILMRTEPKVLAQALATSKAFRERHITEERKELIKEAKFRQHLYDQMSEEEFNSLNNPVSIWLASPELTALLGPNFPTYQGKALMTLELFSAWLRVYATLNNLENRQETSITPDEALSRLLNHTQSTSYWNAIRSLQNRHFRAIFYRKFNSEVTRHLNALRFYLDKVAKYLEKHPTDIHLFGQRLDLERNLICPWTG